MSSSALKTLSPFGTQWVLAELVESDDPQPRDSKPEIATQTDHPSFDIERTVHRFSDGGTLATERLSFRARSRSSS
ncbi:MAG: hypothetical protein U0263_25990 [Polyangiaceae bacterium]